MTTAETWAPPKRRPLHEIVAELIQRIEDNGGVVDEHIDAAELELRDKVEAYNAVLRLYEEEAEAAHRMAQYYVLRERAKADAAESLKRRLLGAFEALGIDRIKTATVTAYTQVCTSVEIEDVETFMARNPHLVRTKREPAKSDAKKLMESGVALEGATLVRTKSMRFR